MPSSLDVRLLQLVTNRLRRRRRSRGRFREPPAMAVFALIQGNATPRQRLLVDRWCARYDLREEVALLVAPWLETGAWHE